ncbi:recombinase family protein [Nocardioides immobilis]|uniref:Recombinase family protein n=1 Tax=Nocardioides immobilis TaxID=2049295 RepID=A0A417XYA3_9ACTN|nr:recombinase family protein [Nocardioides immobilis]RHW25341.1 recombinase family protein [Nocardioides immobilis]
MTGQVVGYGRVSSISQNEARQVESLAGCDRLFIDKASGKNANRPELNAALDYVRQGDTLRVPSMDRLARNTVDLLTLVKTLTERGVTVEFLKERLTFSGDRSDNIGQLMLTILGGIAEFERSLIRERQAEGIALAKARGVYKGRKPALTTEQVTEARERVELGIPKAAVARDLGVSRQTLYSALANP